MLDKQFPVAYQTKQTTLSKDLTDPIFLVHLKVKLPNHSLIFYDFSTFPDFPQRFLNRIIPDISITLLELTTFQV